MKKKTVPLHVRKNNISEMKTFLHHFIPLGLLVCTIQGTPTVIPEEHFDANKDADVLHKAFADSKNLDNKAIQDILSKRICNQRVNIENAYRDLFREELADRIDNVDNGDYKLLLKSLFYCGDDLVAFHLNRVLKEGMDRNDNVIDIMVTQSESAELHTNLLRAYERIFKRPYAEDLKKHLDGDFENVMLEIAGRERKPKEEINEELAKVTADWLIKEIPEWGDNRITLDTTLNETPFEQLNLIFNKFKEMTGKELEDVVKDAFIGSKQNAYLDLIQFSRAYAKQFVEYFASRLMKAVKGPGTDELTVIRIILIHSETNMVEIIDQFRASFNRELSEKIAADVSGQFGELLLLFLSKKDPETPKDDSSRPEAIKNK